MDIETSIISQLGGVELHCVSEKRTNFETV